MTEYKKRFEDDEVIPCDCCRYEGETAVFDLNCEEPRDKPFLFCEICASTFLSSAVIYPSQVSDPNLYKAVAWIGNRILEEIRDQSAKVQSKRVD